MSSHTKAAKALANQAREMEHNKLFWLAQKERVDNNQILEFYQEHVKYLEREIQISGFCSDYRKIMLDAHKAVVKLLISRSENDTN